jgi:hypothetical protein
MLELRPPISSPSRRPFQSKHKQLSVHCSSTDDSRLIRERCNHTSFPDLPNRSVESELKYRLDWLTRQGLNDDTYAFYVVDIGSIESRITRWRRSLGDIQPYYAVKCNPDPLVLRFLAFRGFGFDCASRHELELVTSLNVQSAPLKIVFANPCKPKDISHSLGESTSTR